MTEPETIDLVEDWDTLSLEDRVRALKETVTVPEVAELLGCEIDHSGKITSPWNPDERTPSLHCYEDHFFDFSTGKWGDIFDLVMAFDPVNVKLHDAVRMIRNKAIKVGKQHGDVETAKPREILDFSERLEGAEELSYYHELNLGYVGGYGLVKDASGDVLVPHRDDDGVYGVKVRYAGGGKGSWAGSQYSHRLYNPYGWSKHHPIGEFAVITEGESDCWALDNHLGRSEKFDVFALPSGVGTWRDHWLDDLMGYYRILICMDNDDAGKRCLDKLLLKIGYTRAEPLRVPQLYNDAREALAAGWEPSL